MFMKNGVTVLSLFDGMSCGRIALSDSNIPVYNYYSSEIDKHAITVSKDNWGNTHLGDVKNWRDWNICWSDVDLVLAGSPCQGFSFAGKQLAFDDPRSALFFVFIDILSHIRSVNPAVKFLLENVKMKKEHLEVITSAVGVEPVMINSALLSAQSRQRYYWCNWSVEQPEDRIIHPSSVIQVEIQEPNSEAWQYWWLDKGSFQLKKSYSTVLNWSKKAVCQTARQVASWNGNLVYTVNGLRFATPVECERLQTVPDNYTSSVSNTQRYKMLGNGWTVVVISHILNSSGLCHTDL